MVLGLIDFLLGGKKKTKVPKNAQVSSPGSNIGASSYGMGAGAVPNGSDAPTQNASAQQPQATEGLQFQDAAKDAGNNNAAQAQNASQPQAQAAAGAGASDSFGGGGAPKKISEVLNRMYKEIKETNENVTQISTEIKDMQGNISSLDHRVSELETKDKTIEEKLTDIDDNMSKFLSLYELVNNQYNPFVTMEEPPKKVMVNADGSSGGEELTPEQAREKIKQLDVSNYKPELKAADELKSSLLELDTLDIEEAAGDAVPLTKLKSNTNSLVIILSWLEYLVKKVGVEESKNALRYYTETLKWITPEVFFDLDKFLRGMEDAAAPKSKALSVKDHIVSLYFISKLNEKALDSRLTNAVLQIIKED
jgi:archaellum component FlaD/FlaE